MSTVALSKSSEALRQRWFVAALLLLFAALSVQYTFKVLTHDTAIVRWLEQLKKWDAGEDIFEQFNYPNPPIMALILEPFVHLPPLAAALCFFYLKVGMTLAVFYWVFRLVQIPAAVFPPWAKALTVLLSLRMIMSDLNHGNVNLFILFLVIGALYAFHRRRDGVAGVTLALAIACKVTPALFVPYLIWKRAWATLTACLAGLVLFLFFVPSLKSGWERNISDLHSWVNGMILPYVTEGKVTSEHQNQSLPGVAYRLLTHSPSFSDFDSDNHYVPLQYDNMLSLEPSQARWVIKACMAAFVVLVLWSCRTPIDNRQGWRLAAEYSVILLGMLLFSERTWKHHCVTLVLPFAVICYCLATGSYGAKMRYFLIGSLATATLLIVSTSTIAAAKEGTSSWVQSWDHLGKSAQVYGAFVWAYLVLLVALIVLLRQKDRKKPACA
ncbi:MAG TPA: glycosyltransferase family 87 protein [Gemmataceae bacterium]